MESVELLIYPFCYMRQHKTIKSVFSLNFLYGLLCLLSGIAYFVIYALTYFWKTGWLYISFKLSNYLASAVGLRF